MFLGSFEGAILLDLELILYIERVFQEAAFTPRFLGVLDMIMVWIELRGRSPTYACLELVKRAVIQVFGKYCHVTAR
jgi:hypothetical protein